MSEAILYQSILQKLGQVSPNHLTQIDTYLTVLIGEAKPIKKAKMAKQKSAIDYLVQLAENGGISSIENPIEWQREIRKDRALPYR